MNVLAIDGTTAHGLQIRASGDGLVLHKENIKNIVLDDLQEGIYFVKITNNGRLVKTEKVMVSK